MNKIHSFVTLKTKIISKCFMHLKIYDKFSYTFKLTSLYQNNILYFKTVLQTLTSCYTH